MKIRTIVSAAVALCAVVCSGQAPAQAQAPLKKITFLTNYTFHGRHSPFFVGLDKGYYRDAGFDIEIAPATGSGFVITAVDTGKADYGSDGARTRAPTHSIPPVGVVPTSIARRGVEPLSAP